MSKKNKGFIHLSGEWAKHLRPFGKGLFWSQERMCEKIDIVERIEECEENEHDVIEKD